MKPTPASQVRVILAPRRRSRRLRSKLRRGRGVTTRRHGVRRLCRLRRRHVERLKRFPVRAYKPGFPRIALSVIDGDACRQTLRAVLDQVAALKGGNHIGASRGLALQLLYFLLRHRINRPVD